LESLKNQKSHKHLIKKIRRKVTELEKQNWKIKFNWIKARTGHQENELADQLAKEAATNSDINECYNRIPKSAVKSELSDYSVAKWQIEWERTTKGVTTELYFPKIADRLKVKIRVTLNFTMIVTGHGNIKSYLYKYKIIDSPMCPCKTGEQTTDHISYDCDLVKQERDKLKVEILWSDTLINKYTKIFSKFVDSISLEKL
jgi:hypothetical protein